MCFILAFFFLPNLILILKENPKEVEPKSITNFEEPELAIDFEELKSNTDSNKLESPGWAFGRLGINL
jgi:hypothetical protein